MENQDEEARKRYRATLSKAAVMVESIRASVHRLQAREPDDIYAGHIAAVAALPRHLEPIRDTAEALADALEGK